MSAGGNGPATLTVSLEEHLADALRPLLPLLPEALSADLDRALNAPRPNPEATSSNFDVSPGPPSSSGSSSPPPAVRIIPYQLLSTISKWSRTPAGAQALVRHEPPLSAQDYTMVALLAGTRTSPDRKFPSAAAVADTTADAQAAAQKREVGDRRAVTAVLNALLSIGGAGIATFWAAGRLAWKDEWKVLLALSASIVVAASEAILYVIWDSRRTKRKPGRGRALRFRDGHAQPSPTSPPPDKSEKSEGRNPLPEGGVRDSSVEATTRAATATSASVHVGPGTGGGALRARGRGTYGADGREGGQGT
ncbi:hypothetical protein C8Q78DRAFT_983257 [Trametes maxima]|nr:hypothetical protein C8Q78DRAFT_983257 [Trametes maxima]